MEEEGEVDDGLGSFSGLFQEDDSYFKKPIPPHSEIVEIGKYKICLSLIGEHSLWGHLVWNASKCLSEMFLKNPEYVHNKSVVELGAAGGLPSIISSLVGAKYVMATDYPEEKIISNLRKNVENNLDEKFLENVDVEGYVWNENTSALFKKSKTEYFDVVIMTDLINHHAAHKNLVECAMGLGKSKITDVYVVFSHHRPWLKDEDLKFFEIAKKYKWKIEKIGEVKFKEMFPDDPGDVEIRRTVHCFKCNW